MSDVLTDLAAAVDALEAAMPALLEACTDPDATDMALLLDAVRTQRERLSNLERDTEVDVAKAMVADDVRVPGLWVERYRGTDRKTWQHDEWQRDVRQQAIRKHGLLGAMIVNPTTGEQIDAGVLHTMLAEVQGVHGSAAPKTRSGLGQFGLDARDYCESSPGAWHVKVHRQADETEQQESETDAA